MNRSDIKENDVICNKVCLVVVQNMVCCDYTTKRQSIDPYFHKSKKSCKRSENRFIGISNKKYVLPFMREVKLKIVFQKKTRLSQKQDTLQGFIKAR